MESLGKRKYYNGKYFGKKEEVKLEKMMLKIFNILFKRARDHKF